MQAYNLQAVFMDVKIFNPVLQSLHESTRLQLLPLRFSEYTTL